MEERLGAQFQMGMWEERTPRRQIRISLSHVLLTPALTR
jgi:hypothetical protein